METADLVFEAVQLSADAQELTIEIRPHNTNLMKVTAESADRILDFFGTARATLRPAVAQEWISTEAVEAERDPRVFLTQDRLAGDVLLHVRDPRFGWLHYVLTKNYARLLGEELIRRADKPAPGTQGQA
jgi:hypothetical protein